MEKTESRGKLVLICLLLPFILFNCKKKDTPVFYEKGEFPDTVVNMADINSQYDDYNIDSYELTGEAPFIFSSNRKSSGGQFDLEQAEVTFVFDQTTGTFGFGSEMTNDAFLNKIIQAAITPGNDFGPYRFFSSLDGYEYMVLSSVNGEGNLDLIYFKNRPMYNASLPPIEGPEAITLLNSSFDDAYFCADTNQDSVYFCSDRAGNFDIFVKDRPAQTPFSEWFIQGFTGSVVVDSINSNYNDKCPMVYKKIMLFSSNRPGGLGGYDLYYSILRNGKWCYPVNLGPGINTSYDEYRPVIGSHPDFTNKFLMFSSNRPEGKGGFDLYFTGITLDDK